MKKNRLKTLINQVNWWDNFDLALLDKILDARK